MADQYLILTLFRVKKEIVTEKKKGQLEIELRYIITGNEQTE
jgi:hypothetical protein